MPKKLSDAAVEALKTAQYGTSNAYQSGAVGKRAGLEATPILMLPGQLDRKIYTEVNAALQEVGGTWNRKLKAHVFAEDPRDKIAAMISDGERSDVGKDFGFFETPPELAYRMVELLGPIPQGARVLEPSAGDGALVRALVRGAGAELVGGSLDMIEIRPEALTALKECEELISHVADVHVEIGDFLTHAFLADEAGVIPYDRIIMNPPFSMPGLPLADVTHVQRALELLEPTEGKLVACMSPAWLTSSSQKAVVFRLMLGLPPGCLPIGDGSGVKHAPGSGRMSWKWHENPPGAFRDSGTDVRSGLLVCWYER